MNNLPFGWRRKPRWNCPLCKGKGRILWRLYDSVPPELICIGRHPPKPPKKIGTLRLTESYESKVRREVWMEEAAHYEYDCACVRMHKVNYPLLKSTAAHIQRIIHKEGIPEHTLDDSVDDLFDTPIQHILEYIKDKAKRSSHLRFTK